MAPKEASAFDESDDETTMVQKNTWRTAARKCVYQDQLWRGAVGKILSVVSGPPILKLALLLKLFLMLVYQFKDIGIEHIFNGSRLKPIMRYVFWLILDERYWLEKSIPSPRANPCPARPRIWVKPGRASSLCSVRASRAPVCGESSGLLLHHPPFWTSRSGGQNSGKRFTFFGNTSLIGLICVTKLSLSG